MRNRIREVLDLFSFGLLLRAQGIQLFLCPGYQRCQKTEIIGGNFLHLSLIHIYAALQAEKQAVDQILGNNGRVLIRPSGTEPLLRIMVETADPAEAQSLAERIAAVCRAEAA